MRVDAYESGDVASDKSMSTRATLAANGVLTLETNSKSRVRTEGLRGHVAVVVYDSNGNAIWVSEDHACTTRCGTWDPSCASSGTDSWIEHFPEVVGQHAASLDIVHSDEGLGQMVQNFRNAIKTSNAIASEIKAAAAQWG